MTDPTRPTPLEACPFKPPFMVDMFAWGPLENGIGWEVRDADFKLVAQFHGTATEPKAQWLCTQLNRPTPSMDGRAERDIEMPLPPVEAAAIGWIDANRKRFKGKPSGGPLAIEAFQAGAAWQAASALPPQPGGEFVVVQEAALLSDVGAVLSVIAGSVGCPMWVTDAAREAREKLIAMIAAAPTTPAPASPAQAVDDKGLLLFAECFDCAEGNAEASVHKLTDLRVSEHGEFCCYNCWMDAPHSPEWKHAPLPLSTTPAPASPARRRR